MVLSKLRKRIMRRIFRQTNTVRRRMRTKSYRTALLRLGLYFTRGERSLLAELRGNRRVAHQVRIRKHENVYEQLRDLAEWKTKEDQLAARARKFRKLRRQAAKHNMTVQQYARWKVGMTLAAQKRK